jgi:FkbM family methyltransferase
MFNLSKVLKNADTEYQIGRYIISLPKNHLLPTYQAKFRRYDKVLGDLANVMYEHYPQLRAIDIGANIGDTAVLMNQSYDIPVLCIEGAQQFLPYLRKNTACLGDRVEIKDVYVGFNEASTLNEDASGGTLTLSGDAQSQEFQGEHNNLAQIVSTSPQFLDAKLVKIDTDGFDFAIILSALDFFGKNFPVLFFEYALYFQEGAYEDSLSAIQSLAKIGYSHFAVFDNFGNLLSIISKDYEARFRELNDYLKSNEAFGKVVYYFDVCAFSESDSFLLSKLRTTQER